MFTAWLHMLLAWQPAAAEGVEPRYVPIPFSGNVEEMLRRQLQRARDQAPARRLLDQLRRDFGDGQIPRDLLDKVDLNNPAIRQLVQNYADKLAQGGKIDVKDARNITRDLGKLSQAIPDQPLRPAMPPAPPPQPPGPPRPHQPNDDFQRAVRNLIRDAERSNIGERLRRSPAWNKAVVELQRYFQSRPGQSPLGLGDLAKRLNLPGQLDLKLGDGLLNKVRNFSLPDLPQLNLPQLNLGNWTPHFGGGPSLPSVSGTGMLTFAVWILLACLAVVLVYQVRRRARWTAGQRSHAAGLGPCPVDPAQVATRTQLRLAFEYLALVHLGLEARSFNHRTIETHLHRAQRREGAAAVAALTNLYELARYTQGEEVLSSAEQASARHNLLVLAGPGAA